MTWDLPGSILGGESPARNGHWGEVPERVIIFALYQYHAKSPRFSSPVAIFWKIYTPPNAPAVGSLHEWISQCLSVIPFFSYLHTHNKRSSQGNPTALITCFGSAGSPGLPKTWQPREVFFCSQVRGSHSAFNLPCRDWAQKNPCRHLHLSRWWRGRLHHDVGKLRRSSCYHGICCHAAQ